MSTAISGAIAAAASSVIAPDPVAELVGVAGAAAEQQHELVVAVGDPTEVGQETRAVCSRPSPALAVSLVIALEHAGTDLVEQGAVQVALGVEVLVQHRLGDAGGIGDVVHRAP